LGVIATNKMKAGFQGLLPPNKTGSDQSQQVVEVVTDTTTAVTSNATPFKNIVIKVIAGRDLIAKDFNGKSDPYISIWCGSTKNKTKTKKETLEPVWNETFVIPAASAAKKEIEVECWDADFLTPDEFMGSFKISVDSIPIDQTVQSWYKLGLNKNYKGKVTGDISLEITKNSL
jgi:Ca2+-dependent lipid-binding protein